MDKASTAPAQRDKRLENMMAGLEELESWLQDLVRFGFARLTERGDDPFAAISARMVDAKLGGIARKLRHCSNYLALPDWPSRLAQEIGELYLFLKAMQNFERMPNLLQEDLLTLAGVNRRKEEVLKEGQTVTDQWWVMGQSEGEEENLRFRRIWLRGKQTGRYALLLDYAWGRQEFAGEWLFQQAYDGQLVFYPAVYPQRALVKSIQFSENATPKQAPWRSHTTISAMLEEYASALGTLPWLPQFPTILLKMLPVRQKDQWYALDSTGKMLPLEGDETGWTLRSFGAGNPIALFGEWDGRQFTALSAGYAGRVIKVAKK